MDAIAATHARILARKVVFGCACEMLVETFSGESARTGIFSDVDD